MSLVIINNVAAQMREVTEQIDQALHEEIVAVSVASRKEIQSTWPRDTGLSADAFRDAEETYGASVRCRVRYAGYVHEGEAAKVALEITERQVAAGIERFKARIG